MLAKKMDWKEAARRELKMLQDGHQETVPQRSCEGILPEICTPTVGSEGGLAQFENTLVNIIRKNERLDHDVEKACKEKDRLRGLLEEKDECTRKEDLEMRVQELKDELELERLRSSKLATDVNRLHEQLDMERSRNAHRPPGLTLDPFRDWDEDVGEPLPRYPAVRV